MTAYSGVVKALKESGVLHCVTYIGGLSGSSWYVLHTQLICLVRVRVRWGVPCNDSLQRCGQGAEGVRCSGLCHLHRGLVWLFLVCSSHTVGVSELGLRGGFRAIYIYFGPIRSHLG